MSKGKQARHAQFATDYPAWIALSHFLSADLVRELAEATVIAGSGGTVGLADLCEEWLSQGPSELISWAIRLKAGRDGIAGVLQDVLRALTWQSDARLSFDESRVVEADKATCHALGLALTLASSDFGSIDRWMDQAEQVPPTLKEIGDAIQRAARRNDEPVAETMKAIDGIVASIGSPLAALAMKHLGDLALDVDDAELALAFYEHTDAILSVNDAPAWTSLFDALRDMTQQSVATVKGMLVDPSETVKALAAISSDELFKLRPLLGMNAPLAAMNARYKASESFQFDSDIRACILIAPQLQATLDLSTPLEEWADNKFSDAHRRFWATLRRLNAVGGATLSTRAMSYYGRSMFDELGKQTQRHRQPETFKVALQLIVGSGRTEAVGPEASRQEFVDAYVDVNAARHALAVAVRHRGVRLERLGVVIALFEAWLRVLSSEEEGTAAVLIETIADLSRETNVSVFGRDPGAVAFEAIKTIARQRPEFVSLASATIAETVAAGCASAQFRVASVALETAVACSEALAKEDLAHIIDTALGIVEGVEPSDGGWPIMRPALSLISGSEAQALWPDNLALASRSAQCILRHGLGSASENIRLLSLIDDIRPYLDQSMIADERITEVINAVREGAQNINNSGVTGNIAALFATAALVGRSGIEDAIKGLLAILASARAKHPSIAVADAYHPLEVLRQHFDEILAALDLDNAEERALFDPIVDAVESFWTAAADNPLLFAPFAIPIPTTPNAIVVQNWAFVTLGFAHRTDSLGRLGAAIDHASNHKLLAKPIALGKAIRLTAGDLIAFDVNAIHQEGRDPFYAALGERSAHLSAMPEGEDLTHALTALVERCLVLGPNGLDAGIFSMAIRIGGVRLPAETIVNGYRNRLNRDRGLVRGLHPLVRALTRIVEPALHS